MNILDRVVLAFAPERGERRIRARKRAEVAMNFDAASRGRRTAAWKAPATSADAAAHGSRERLRQLSRDFVRNRSFAARAMDVVGVNVVGAGILPSVDAMQEGPDQVEGLDLKKAVERVIRKHLLTTAIDARGRQTLLQMQLTVINAVFTDGEVLARRRMRNPRFQPGLALPYQIELLEPDLLDHGKTHHGQNQVIEGVEYGPIGRVEAYHLFDRHPGDVTWWDRGKLDSRRVPASEIIHVYRADRPGQMRGVPWLAPVMLTLGEISDYQEAQILKQRMAALMAGVVESEDEAHPFQGSGLESLAPGAVVGLGPGQKINWTTPPAVDDYDDFMRAALQAVAMGIGITFEALAGDLRGVNFSSGRMGRMEMDRLVEQWQTFIMIEQFCRGVGRWFAEAWALRSDLPQGAFEIGWTAPRRPLIDPGKEVAAMVAEVEAGLTSRQRQQRRLGYDPVEIERERIEDAERGGQPAPGSSGAVGAGETDTDDHEGGTGDGRD